MTNNVKRFLAASLLSLMPSVALAEQYGVEELLSERHDYVSVVQEEIIQLPSGRLEGNPSLRPATTVNDFYIGNWTGVNTFPGYSVTGTPNPLPPSPLPPVASPSISGHFQMITPLLSPLTQLYYYTTNPADPTGAAKTCRWILTLTVTNGVCSGSINQAAFGTQGAVCTLSTSQTFVDPMTCQAQVVTAIQ
ncbi:hypothetical protein G4177_04955 [Corallococcus sp. ZKHCc1 1396]|uniref:Uncharacterized protein n=1 Tax=Corallococcus soli TaxID=2710757 RepID=A0ABR9PHZ9_9BACT|nr:MULTISPECIES: hypothetical protein [Corallococcus]MBE4747530.1 hypothetical protein [Corallococcus soli]MCY1031746.1 hypothetical protein [Corallococcus sp. BB11-1]